MTAWSSSTRLPCVIHVPDLPDMPEAVDEPALQICSRHEQCESEKDDAMLKNHHEVTVRKLLGSLCKCVG